MEFSVVNILLVSMATVTISLLGVSRMYGRTVTDEPCPCNERRFCDRITDTDRKEIFAFSFKPKHGEWRFYDWDKVTTVVMVGYIDMDLVCAAHMYGARAITIGNVDTAVLPNASARAEWIAAQLDIVKKNYLDGVNFDYENAILDSQVALKEGYTQLVAETKKAFTDYFPQLQISVDVAWSPGCVDLRCYDYLGLSKNSDFLFVMAYDEQSQIRGKCVAGANSGFKRAMSGIDGYLDIGVSRDKLVLGVPWYGYYYPCLSLSAENECALRQVPFRGVNCSDAAGKEISYSRIIQLLKNSSSGRIFDEDALSPFFNYLDPTSGVMHQIWYDDPKSLEFKYQLAVNQNLRGVGMWIADDINYTSQLPDDIKAAKEMWDALPDYKFL